MHKYTYIYMYIFITFSVLGTKILPSILIWGCYADIRILLMKLESFFMWTPKARNNLVILNSCWNLIKPTIYHSFHWLGVSLWADKLFAMQIKYSWPCQISRAYVETETLSQKRVLELYIQRHTNLICLIGISMNAKCSKNHTQILVLLSNVVWNLNIIWDLKKIIVILVDYFCTQLWPTEKRP